MKKITAEDPESCSADLIEGNLDRLRDLFPQAFTEDGIDFTTLRELLGDDVVEREERYGLNWHGKAQARRLALTPSTGTLRPAPDESVDWDSTQNLIIEGDNLEVLKLLQKSYAGQMKLIFIDPPYNTGKDFVYPDDYRDNIANYLERTRQVDGSGAKTSSNSEASGRLHTDWLNMVYPRLMLARQLLRDDGVLAVTIDDTEQSNLRLLLDAVFGSENFLANVAWQKAYVANMTAKHISTTHDHVVLYAKNESKLRFGRIPRTAEQIAKFENPDGDPRGPWKAENLSAGKFYAAGQYQITTPAGVVVSPPPGRYWRCNEEKFKALHEDGRIWFGKDGTGRPMLKKFVSEVRDGLTPDTWWVHGDAGSNKEATIQLKALFGGEQVFDTPKPVKLLRRLIRLCCGKGDPVLDFFAGSGVTGHAVLEANADDGGTRPFVLVQLPEATGRKDYRTIADITKERVRRAASKVREEAGLTAPQDLGFRVFKLDSTNVKPWDPSPEDLQTELREHIDHIKPGRSEEDLLYEALLKLGLDLSVGIESRVIEGLAVYNIGAGQLMACLGAPITRALATPLARGIIEWHRATRPDSTPDSASSATLLFRDAAFVDDVAKQNLVHTLKQAGFNTIRSL